VIDQLRKLVAPLATRIANTVARAVITNVDDTQKVQLLQLAILDGETRDDVEAFGQYGLTSNPPKDSEAVILCVGGRRDHPLAIGIESRQDRIKNLQPGEVALYSKHGQTIVLKANGDIELNPKAGQVVAVAGQSNPIAKGDSLNSAISTLATAIGSAVALITPTTPGTAAQTAITAATVTFDASAAAALSTKAKLS
jgi:phage baseplate assembly protein V